jgi:D-serine deaminase-like pyridoxal phosphate-dependent protein
MDNTPLRLGLISEDRIALKILATVVSKNDDYYIVDAGSKILSSDTGAHGSGVDIGFGYAYPLEKYDKQGDFLVVCRLSEEHGFLKRNKTINLSIGQKVLILPNHSCAVINLADYVTAVYPNGNFQQWPIAARGCSK